MSAAARRVVIETACTGGTEAEAIRAAIVAYLDALASGSEQT